MKHIFTLLTTLCISVVSFSQTITATATTASNLGTGRAWTTTLPFTATPLNNGQQLTQYLYLSGFSFTGLPANISVNSMTVSFTRYATAGTISDEDVRLVLGGVVNTDPNGNAAFPNATTWPVGSGNAQSNVYTFDPAFVNTLTAADLTNPAFGIAISARRSGTTNNGAVVTTFASVTITYTVLAPLILTDFSVTKNADNHVEIRFSTASEENVQNIFIERSSDGRNFEKLFTIAPRGARNVYTSYMATDKAPATGNNYYRISEVDKNGRQYQYLTKVLSITRRGASFGAYFNGGQVIASISNLPGTYEVSMVDMSGITLARKTATLNSGTGTVNMDAPLRSGIYIVNIKGQGISESVRVAVTK